MRGTNEELIALVAQLKGRKVLIKGNHDDVSDMRYKNVFEEIYDYKEITDYADQDAYKLVLSHYPILMWNGQHICMDILIILMKMNSIRNVYAS